VVVPSSTVPLLELFYACLQLPPPPPPPPGAALMLKNRTFSNRAKKGGSQRHCTQRGRGFSQSRGGITVPDWKHPRDRARASYRAAPWRPINVFSHEFLR